MDRLRNSLIVLWMLIFVIRIAAQADDSSPIEIVACPFAIPADTQMTCGLLAVPENRSAPESAIIRIAFAVIHSAAVSPDADPIIYLAGGPGGSTLPAFPQNFSTRYRPLLATNRDIILFDQRGTGSSQPVLQCRDYQDLMIDVLDYEVQGVSLTNAALSTLKTDTLAACGDTLSSQLDLRGYTSAESAADIEALRQSLGYEQVNLWGISYGTRLALTMMRDYPASVRSVVLDSVYPPDANLYLDLPENLNRSLQALFTACETDSACDLYYPDLRTIFYTTLEKLHQEPARIDAVNPLSGVRYTDVVLNDGAFISLIFQLLYDSSILPHLPRLIYDAWQGHYDQYGRIIGMIVAQQAQISTGMNIAFQCNEEISFASPGDLARAWQPFPELQAYPATSMITESLFDVCAAFAAGTPSPVENIAVTSDIPALLLAGAYDPVTPPQWSRNAAATLSHHQIIELTAGSHGSSGSPGCAQNLTIAFLIDPYSPLDTACLSDEPINFSTPPVAGDFRSIDLHPYGIDAITVIPADWQEDSSTPGRFIRQRTADDEVALHFIGIGRVQSHEMLAQLINQQGTVTLPGAYIVLDTNYVQWHIYPVRFQGQSSYLALGIHDTNGILVWLSGNRAIRDTILIPVLRAFSPRSQTG